MQLKDVVDRGRLFVLTGAGLSTESGIPDYRRPDGTRRTVPMTYQQFMATPSARRRYWARSAVGWEAFSGAQPNVGHHAVTRLQEAGLVHHVVTQNVDGLHQRAGTRDVTELHGNLDWVVCAACGARRARREYQEQLRAINPQLPERATLLADGDAEIGAELEHTLALVPCERCRADVMKPDVVMFGESVAPDVVAQQYDHLERSAGVLVLGSSLKVMSGYRFVLAALRAGTPVAIVGLGDMRGQDKADVVVHAPLGEVLTQLTGELGGVEGRGLEGERFSRHGADAQEPRT